MDQSHTAWQHQDLLQVDREKDVGRAAMMAGMYRKRAEKYLRLRWRRWRKEGDGSTELQKRHLAPVDETTVKVLTSFHNMGILRKMNIDEDATDAR